MAKSNKRVYAADTRATLQVHLAVKAPTSVRQPADTPHGVSIDRSTDTQRQEVVQRLIDFFKGL
jgi:hypothetical protein